MKSIRTKIREVRPNLKDVFPMIFYLVLGFGIFNVALGATMFIKGVNHLVIITPVTPSWLWASVFILTGGALLISLLINSWRAIRFFLLIGILLKTIWSYALIFSPVGITFVLPVWLFVSYVQIMTYVLFTPSRNVSNE